MTMLQILVLGVRATATLGCLGSVRMRMGAALYKLQMSRVHVSVASSLHVVEVTSWTAAPNTPASTKSSLLGDIRSAIGDDV